MIKILKLLENEKKLTVLFQHLNPYSLEEKWFLKVLTCLEIDRLGLWSL
jgi:hypothetical protein